MKIQIDVRWPRFLRGRPRWARLTVVALVAAGVLAVPIAWASHDFTDVPNANPFHGSISAIKDAGITGGKTCVPPGTPPTYCPQEGITREAMAAFLHRGLTRMGSDASFVGLSSGAVDTVVASVAFTLDGAPGTQGIRVRFDVQADIDTAVVAGCFPNLALRRGGVILDTWTWEVYTDDGGDEKGISATFVETQATNTTATYELVGDNPCSESIFFDEEMMTVENFAFSGSGGIPAAAVVDTPHDG